jgi:ribonuclease P protein component
MQRPLRLRRSEDFGRLRREGRAYRHPFLILSLAPNGLPHNRYGFITARRLGKAVQRNRVRRLLREAMRTLHPHLRSGHDVALIARPAIVGQPYAAVYAAVVQKTRQASLLLDEENDLDEMAGTRPD